MFPSARHCEGVHWEQLGLAREVRGRSRGRPLRQQCQTARAHGEISGHLPHLPWRRQETWHDWAWLDMTWRRMFVIFMGFPEIWSRWIGKQDGIHTVPSLSSLTLYYMKLYETIQLYMFNNFYVIVDHIPSSKYRKNSPVPILYFILFQIELASYHHEHIEFA